MHYAFIHMLYYTNDEIEKKKKRILLRRRFDSHNIYAFFFIFIDFSIIYI
jgi:hypothetical protein